MDPILVAGGRCQQLVYIHISYSALRSVHYIVAYVYAATQRYRSNATMVIRKRGRHSTATPAAVECFVAVSFDLHAVE